MSILVLLVLRLTLRDKLPERDMGASAWLALGPIGTGALGLLLLGGAALGSSPPKAWRPPANLRPVSALSAEPDTLGLWRLVARARCPKNRSLYSRGAAVQSRLVGLYFSAWRLCLVDAGSRARHSAQSFLDYRRHSGCRPSRILDHCRASHGAWGLARLSLCWLPACGTEDQQFASRLMRFKRSSARMPPLPAAICSGAPIAPRPSLYKPRRLKSRSFCPATQANIMQFCTCMHNET